MYCSNSSPSREILLLRLLIVSVKFVRSVLAGRKGCSTFVKYYKTAASLYFLLFSLFCPILLFSINYYPILLLFISSYIYCLILVRLVFYFDRSIKKR